MGRQRPGWGLPPGWGAGCVALLPGWPVPGPYSGPGHSHGAGGVLAVEFPARVLMAMKAMKGGRAMKAGATSSSLSAPPPASPLPYPSVCPFS